MDCSQPGISQERILEWVAISSSRGSSHPGINLRFLHWQEDSLPSEPLGKPEMGITALIFHNRTLRLGECHLLKTHRALSAEAAVQASRLQVCCFSRYTTLPSRRLPKELRSSPSGRQGSNDLGSAERKEWLFCVSAKYSCPLQYDLDIKRLICEDSRTKEKCFFIMAPNESESSVRKAMRLGNVQTIGVDKFAQLIKEGQESFIPPITPRLFRPLCFENIPPK